MNAGRKGADVDNRSDTAREKRIRELAVLDWARTPSMKIREHLGEIHWQTLCDYRNTDVYKQVVADLRAEWDEQMMRLPSTAELKKKVQQAMTLGVDAVIEILSNAKTVSKDKIAAARLAAQLDGRFLKGSEDEDDRIGRNADSVAQELLTAIKRHETVN